MICGGMMIAGWIIGCGQPTAAPIILDPLPSPYVTQHTLEPPMALPATQPANANEAWLPQKKLYKGWRYLVIHHTAIPFGSLKDVDESQRDKGWELGCGYHFVIGNGTRSADGLIEVGPRWQQQAIGAHTRLSPEYARRSRVQENYYNKHGIGIALIGNFEERKPTERQMASLAKLVKFLMTTCDIDVRHIVGQGDVDQTKCPGRYFSMDALIERIEALP